MTGYWRGVLHEHLRAETAKAVEYARLHPVPAEVWTSTTIVRSRPAIGWLTRQARRTNGHPS